MLGPGEPPAPLAVPLLDIEPAAVLPEPVPPPEAPPEPPPPACARAEVLGQNATAILFVQAAQNDLRSTDASTWLAALDGYLATFQDAIKSSRKIVQLKISTHNPPNESIFNVNRAIADGLCAASQRRKVRLRPSTTLAEFICASVSQGFVFGSMDTVEAAANEADSALSLITDSVADDPTVALAKIHYLRSRCEPETWWDFASERHRRYPDNENLAGAAAEARIDQAARWAETNQRRTLNRELRAQIAEAIAILEQMRQKFAGSEAAWDDNRMSLSVNLAIGLRLLRQHDEAKKVIEAALFGDR
ncbi:MULTISPECIES: hypothetical protein [unclassified Bradyrhizobium]|uniref:hypothetical protein n=1 Tax=unclassified Bradyrhizobium TaxID=2631580 RepID=UPI0012F812BB|nr:MULTISPECIES: hypothetical protein [unclassified Bradyrhizobium]MCK1314226.1 hypothetical protein [Bradyrhizobium sp. 23]MCK1692367.1 hypothetical protein [Bradyrhizobium sp. 144]